MLWRIYKLNGVYTDVVANVKETLHYYENKRINDNINFSFIWISKL